MIKRGLLFLLMSLTCSFIYGQNIILKILIEKSNYILLVSVDRIPERIVTTSESSFEKLIVCKIIKEYKGKPIIDSTFSFSYYFSDNEKKKPTEILKIGSQLILFVSSKKKDSQFAFLVDQYFGYIGYNQFMEYDLENILSKNKK